MGERYKLITLDIGCNYRYIIVDTVVLDKEDKVAYCKTEGHARLTLFALNYEESHYCEKG